MRVALVHDYLKEFGGAERVLEALHEIWPEAPVYTSFVDWQGLGPHAERIEKWNIIPSWANNWWMKKWHSPLRFLAPYIWESFDFRGFDVVISSSGWYICRGIITQPKTVHICYLHHPPRALYGYATAVEWQHYGLVRAYAALVNHNLRIYDYLAAQRVDYFIANSKETRRRIVKFYRRESEVIYPPVTQTGPAARQPHNLPTVGTPIVGLPASRHPSGVYYYLCVSRLARVKHIDLAIQACHKLGVLLKIVGRGREGEQLKAKSERLQAKVEFLGEISDEALVKIYQGARALICPFEDEEFGIVAVEAMSYGVPVIGYRSGGIPEVVVDGKTGILFDELTVAALVDVLKRFDDSNHRTITPARCRKQAAHFSERRFRREIRQFVEEKWEEYTRRVIRRSKAR